ncbi:MAG: hypothetical protein ABJC63_13550 [Gemmatimonadales bacterium]
MKKYLLALCFLAACSRASTTTTTTTTPVRAPTPKTTPAQPAPRADNGMAGAESPRAAVLAFLDAVKAQDIQAMSVIFGTSQGPSRDNMDRGELEKRLIILQCYFSNDKFRITEEMPGERGHRIFTVELTKAGNIRTPRFYSIAGPGGRFYVDNMEIAAVRDFCRK